MDNMNAITKFETAYGTVELSPEIVTKYLKRGNAELTDQEITLFINLCKFQKINPFVGEAYAIKFGSEFQMIVGYDTYKRRAEDNAAYRGRKSGITVLRGQEIVQKEGCCLYPNETLVGGWCRVYRMLHDKEVEDIVEVSLAEYNKKQANWNTKPATMIQKVAVSQALRAAFPKDYTGLYTQEEMPDVQDNTAPQPPRDVTNTGTQGTPPPMQGSTPATEEVSSDERKIMFNMARLCWGSESIEKVKAFCRSKGYESTTQMTRAHLDEITAAMNEILEQKEAQGIPPEDDYTVQ